ncbi:MAG TPA: putative lipid II flippase FtsW [Bdellovibrionales bacterium]|nr:putative lipid II flippase FtsW [Bdellovibrionales bacterium]
MLLIVLGLIGVGLVQVYSSSFIFAIESHGDGLFFFKKQLLFAALSIPVMLGVALVPWRNFERWGFLLWLASFVLILATFVPGLSHKAGGAARWVNLGPFKFEPAELLKLSLPFVFGTFLCLDTGRLGIWRWPVFAAVIGAPMGLLLLQPDFGSVVISSAVLLTLLFYFGLKWRYIIASMIVLVPAFYFMVVMVPYRRARLLAFMDPWSDPGKGGFQVIQSLLSLYSGGLWGAGLGQGQGKLFFLPEAHTDFTLAVLGEEMGFAGVGFIIFLYSFLIFRGFQIAARSQSVFAQAVALGLTVTFAFQVVINMGVVMGLLPTKGLTLPFLSYGGSSLLMSALMFGILLNIGRYVPTKSR